MDTIPRQDDEVPNYQEALNVEDILKDIKFLIDEHGGSKDRLKAYLENVEEQVQSFKQNAVTEADKQQIKLLVEKHPYFKNPCNYHIRLITIMKYLKRKGINIAIEDIDLVVDSIIESIDGVVKVEYGRYYRIRA
ncbi:MULTISPECIES: hypothetical protein [unclassified Fusibacter]|uniref:hypothetical protein n=1 Tax=unclassified Fusibacter TaxID=2624464 RepID=UPI001011FAB1|nr:MULTISPECIES: hypothetical protein [unclassified Fusibacter]MCK8060699.1 hypothetical protein [Fusibacter sp. A2]NPE22847.1 hypothetical protein [Fusibacter sp. A1]RXV59916.1 hypothetical protein DWB64_13455 [Fusibacter sp. A1]